MNKIVSFQELENGLLQSLTPLIHFTQNYNYYYKDLLFSGCRPKELMDYNLWTFIGDDRKKIRLKPFKKNNYRYFNTAGFSSEFIDAIKNQKKPYKQIYYNRAVYAWKYFSPLINCYVIDKRMDLYLFRYYKVKKLIQDGMTKKEVQQYMGWKDDYIVVRYNSAIIRQK